MLESGEYGSLAERADAEQSGDRTMSRILLSRSSLNIVKRILDGWPTARLADAQAISSRVGEAAELPPVDTPAARVWTASDMRF